jgi:hypothetical protein
MKGDKLVYHYTSLQGLLGITESKAIRATNILYLNDASELDYSKSLFCEEIQHLRKTNEKFKKHKTLDDSLGYFYLQSLEENMNTLFPSKQFSFFVSSFSEESDLLSQWRGYGKNGSGFSLGFSLNKLQECIKKSKIVMYQCIYKENDQRVAIRSLLKKTCDHFINEIGNSADKAAAWDEKTKPIAVAFFLKFIQLAPLLKHPKFIEEKEWRVIAALQTEKIIKLIKFRPGSHMIIPYIDINLPTEDANLVIDELMVGPSNDSLLSAASVELMLKARSVVNRKLSHSTIPYRTL